MKAIITRSGKDFYRCQLSSGEFTEAVALPSLLESIQPVVGDRVTLIESADYKYKVIEEVEERDNEIYRLIVREKKKKVIASNLNQLVIVMSISKPKYKQGLLDRYLLRGQQWEIPTVVVFNKADEMEDDFDLSFERQRLKLIGVDNYVVSAHDPDKFEMKELKKKMENQTSIFLGQSGVGKSKLISALSDGAFDLLTGVLAKVGKGAHTTTWAELIKFDKFSIIDSPGVRSMNLDDIFKENLQFYFQDLIPWFEKCQFSDCQHKENSKGCGFESLDSEKLEDAIIISRLNSYLRFFDQAGETPTWLRKKALR